MMREKEKGERKEMVKPRQLYTLVMTWEARGSPAPTRRSSSRLCPPRAPAPRRICPSTICVAGQWTSSVPRSCVRSLSRNWHRWMYVAIPHCLMLYCALRVFCVCAYRNEGVCVVLLDGAWVWIGCEFSSNLGTTRWRRFRDKWRKGTPQVRNICDKTDLNSRCKGELLNGCTGIYQWRGRERRVLGDVPHWRRDTQGNLLFSHREGHAGALVR